MRALENSSYRCPVKVPSARRRLWCRAAQLGASCCLLLLWFTAPAAAQEKGRSTASDPPEAASAPEEETEFDLVDVLVTRTPLPASDLEVGYRFERSSQRLATGSATTHTNEPFVSGSLAVTDRLQLSAILPYDFINTRTPDHGTVTTNGVADLTTEVQFTFLQSQALHLAVAGGLGVGIPTGSASKSTGGLWTLTPFLSAGKVLGQVQLLADVGYQAAFRTMPDRQQQLLYDVAVGYPVLEDKLFPFLELNGAYTFTGPSNLRHRGQVVLTPGVRITPGGWFTVLAEREPSKTAKPIPAEEPWWERLSMLVGLQVPVTASRGFEWALTTSIKLDF
jgi:outer membrane putative beta-barrel porin/alpha-amylase